MTTAKRLGWVGLALVLVLWGTSGIAQNRSAQDSRAGGIQSVAPVVDDSKMQDDPPPEETADALERTASQRPQPAVVLEEVPESEPIPVDAGAADDGASKAAWVRQYLKPALLIVLLACALTAVGYGLVAYFRGREERPGNQSRESDYVRQSIGNLNQIATELKNSVRGLRRDTDAQTLQVTEVWEEQKKRTQELASQIIEYRQEYKKSLADHQETVKALIGQIVPMVNEKFAAFEAQLRRDLEEITSKLRNVEARSENIESVLALQERFNALQLKGRLRRLGQHFRSRLKASTGSDDSPLANDAAALAALLDYARELLKRKPGLDSFEAKLEQFNGSADNETHHELIRVGTVRQWLSEIEKWQTSLNGSNEHPLAVFGSDLAGLEEKLEEMECAEFPPPPLVPLDPKTAWSPIEANLLDLASSFYLAYYDGVIDLAEESRMRGKLKPMGIEPVRIDKNSSCFNPDYHHVADNRPSTENLPDLTIVGVVECGFQRTNGEVIRKAGVITHVQG